MALAGKFLDDGCMRAGVDLSTYAYCAVKISGDNTVGPANTGGEAITGILYNNPVSGDPAQVVFTGFPKAIAGAGGWTAGDKLVTEATTARLITYTGSGTVVAIACNTVAAGVFGKVKLLVTA